MNEAADSLKHDGGAHTAYICRRCGRTVREIATDRKPCSGEAADAYAMVRLMKLEKFLKQPPVSC